MEKLALKVIIFVMPKFKTIICSLFKIFKVQDSKMYIAKVAKRVAEILETRFITGPDLPIDDYTASIK